MNDRPLNTNIKSLYPKEPFEDIDDDSWQVSYLDIITIILGFLIILLSVSQIAKPEFSSLSSTFGGSSDKTEYITTPVEEIVEELTELLRPQIEAGRLIIYKDLNDVRIRLKGDEFYSSGNATLQGLGMDLLNHVIRAFQQSEYTDFNIDVEGHTDNVPITNASFPSNWELSTARASNVVKYFSSMGLEEKRLEASGYADSKPLIQYDSFGNPFAASNDQNRRVVLRLYYTSEGLQKLNAGEAFTELDEGLTIPEPEVIETTTEIDSRSSQLAQEIQRISDANENASYNPLTTPEVVTPEPEAEEEETAPVIDDPVSASPSELSESITTNELDAIPSFLENSAMCGFSVQIGNFQSLSSGFQVANNAKNQTGYEFELTSNNRLYSVRTKPMSSFSYALGVQQEIATKMDDSTIGLVHQCYENSNQIPTPVQYQIQFGAFSSQDNALNYTIRMDQEYQIQTYMNRRSSTYNVVAGPYDNREGALEDLRSFRTKGVEDNIFIKPINESNKDFKFAYQIQLDSFSSQTEAQALSNRIFETLGISSSVSQSSEGSFYILTDRTSNWDEAVSQFARFKNRIPSSNPVIFYLEYI